MSARRAVLAAFVLIAGAIGAAQQSSQPSPPQRPVRDLPATRSGPGTGVIAGVVRAADTGLPIRGVDIRLTATGTALPGGARGAFTDAGGRYEFVALPDGQYTLTASKVRYMTMTYGQTRAGEEGRLVQVTGGQRVAAVDFSLPAGAVIVLRVGNRFGDPAVGYRVNLYQAKFGAGQRALAQIQTSVFGSTSDDRGEIRISGLAPGEYYVSAGENGPPTQVPGEREVQTFYPGTPAEADAQPIAVGLGEEVVIAFNTVVSRTSRISGTVVGGGRPDLRLERRTPLGMTIIDILLNVATDGSFSRANLSPGEYVLTARTATEMGSLAFEVGTNDVSGLVVPMRPVQPIRGRLTFEGTVPSGIAQTAFVLYPAAENTSVSPVAQYKPDGTFEMPLPPGAGVLRFRDLPRGWFMKAVMLEGVDVSERVLDFGTYQGKSVDVVVTQTATEISGRVADAAGRDVANYVAVVFPDDPQQWTRLTRTIASVRSDQQGRFSLRGLPPGRYLVAAVDYLQSGQERDRQTLERLRPRATEVTLAEGATETVMLRLVQ